METLELRYFVTVAEAGSFSRASVELDIAQPSLSRQVRKLEQELKSSLFYRHGRGVSLTATGSKLFDAVKPLLAKLSEIKEELIQDGDKPSGTVVLGVPPSIGATLGAPLSRRFSEECPGATLRVHEAFSSNLLEWVESGRLDLAVLYDARRGRNLIVSPLLRESLFLIEAPGNNVASTTVSLLDVAAKTLILPGPENGLRRVLDTAVAKAGLTLTVRMEIDSVTAIKQLVGSGEGATVLPFGSVHREVSEGNLIARRIDSTDTLAMLVTATPLHRPVTKATRSLLAFVHAEVKRSVSAGILVGETSNLEMPRQIEP